ncbi:MAG: radical SAM protein [Candidatus Omnitrophota bacterium]
MKKVLLINSPSTLDQRYGFLSPAGGVEIPTGLCSLAAFLRNEGIPVGIIDAQALHYDDPEILAQVKLEKPGYVALSATTSQIRGVATLAGKIKSLEPSVIIFIGGAHVSALPIETLQEHAPFDIGVVGEGEETLREVIQALEEKTDIAQVKGLVFRDPPKVLLSGTRSRIKDLDALPQPAFDLLPALDKHYSLPIQHVYRLPAVSLMTSRGCPGQCTFCDRSVFGNRMSFHSAEYMVAMLKTLKRDYGIRHVMFQDDEFFSLKRRLIDFCRLLKEARLNMTWAASVRVDSVDQESLRMAKDSGCWQLSYGIESANQQILDVYQKGISLEVIKRALRETREAGILTKGFLLLGNPLETPETVQETIDFIKSQPLDDVSVTFFTPYPGAALFHAIKGFGRFENDYDKMTCFDIVFVPHGMTKESLIAYRKKLLREFYLRPAIMASYVRRIRSFQQLKIMIKSAWSVLDHILRK